MLPKQFVPGDLCLIAGVVCMSNATDALHQCADMLPWQTNLAAGVILFFVAGWRRLGFISRSKP